VAVTLAHRGDWSTVPENTLAAFAAAERAGADMVELDVQVTADGAVVVLHDETLQRIWGVPRAVAQMTLDEVREVRSGEHGIPTLAEALAACTLPVMLDYKEESGAVEPALAEVRAADAVDRVIWAGHNLEGHALLRSLEPAARIALSWTNATPASERLLRDLGVEWFNPAWELVDPELVELMHGRGVGVSTWTVDDEAVMRGVLDAGVDAVITNRIGALVALLEESAC
jgi:glycerophosphoryl diester phosphodiesterase